MSQLYVRSLSARDFYLAHGSAAGRPLPVRSAIPRVRLKAQAWSSYRPRSAAAGGAVARTRDRASARASNGADRTRGPPGLGVPDRRRRHPAKGWQSARRVPVRGAGRQRCDCCRARRTGSSRQRRDPPVCRRLDVPHRRHPSFGSGVSGGCFPGRSQPDDRRGASGRVSGSEPVSNSKPRYALVATHIPPPELFSRLTSWFVQGGGRQTIDWGSLVDGFETALQTLERRLTARLRLERLDGDALVTHLHECLHRRWPPSASASARFVPQCRARRPGPGRRVRASDR